MRVGFRFLFANRELSFATLAMGAGTFAAGCYSSLAGVYVRDTLHATPLVYGALGSSTAIGMFAGSSLMAKLARAVQCGVQKGFLHGEKVIALGMGVVGLCIALLAAFPVTPVALLGSFGIGVGAASALVMANAVVRERTPAELRGRVVSVSVAMMSAAQAAAILVAGNGAAWIGVRGVFGLSAAMLLAQPACRYFRRGTVRSEPAACFQNLR